MAGEHINVLMAADTPARKSFTVDRHEPEGWVGVAEYATLEGALDAKDRLVDEGHLAEDEVRVRGERGRFWAGRVWLGVLAAMAIVNAALYAMMLAAE